MSERTPLLPTHTNAEAGPSRPVPQATLNTEANILISHLKSPSTVSYAPLNLQIDLAVHLYALHLLDPKRYKSHVSIRARISDSELGRKLREAINDRIEDLLDGHCNLAESVDEDEDGDGEMQGIFWRRWRVNEDNDRAVNVIDLLLPPFAPSSHPSPFQSHPLVRHILELTWNRGVYIQDVHPQTRLSRLQRRIAEIATPSISPYDPSSENPRWSRREVWWVLWAGSDLIHSIQYPIPTIRRVLLLPLHLSFLLSLFPSYGQLSYTLLLLSIPTMTFSLVLPNTPSIPILLPSLLPLSILLKRILVRSVRSAGLLMPLVLGLFVLFSWSMNGDIFRGFYQTLSSRTITVLYTTANTKIYTPLQTQVAEPIEEGISPFAARLTIFITLSLLLVFSMLLTASRAIMTPRERWDREDERRWKGAVKEGDNWEKEFGVRVAGEAREGFCEGVKRYTWGCVCEMDEEEAGRAQVGYESITGGTIDGVSATEGGPRNKHDQVGYHGSSSKPISPVLPPPLNLITLPLDILSMMPLGHLSDTVDKARYSIRLVIAALVCLPFYLVSMLYRS
uniref:Uncharacterized protein n=1 Tax=Kwoniella bestiolae CBS 10118 TaxID=1296100 RepID=A0A1B9GG95_9TREE|nr:hypothetical protein I302_01578 [Kwoniella bestiolae CBS 10118]OCF30059.1 hypothetical protein I302_01578 [Kwoniella bestiolae CBS 10118]